MKIAYVVNARIPTEKAHGYQIVRTCSEWKKAGVDVTLYVPERANHIAEDAFSFYGIDKNFEVVYVKCSQWINHAKLFGPLAFYLQSKSFLGKLFTANLIPNDALIYTRDAEAVSFFSRRGFSCVYNAHNWPAHPRRMARLLRGVKGIVCNSNGTERVVRASIDKPTVVSHNAADENPFKNNPKPSVSKKVITYVGHLYGWKGTDIIIPLARVFRGNMDILFQVIGGTPADIERFSAKLAESGLANVLLLGYKKKSLIPKYLAESDVLLLPNMPSSEESMRYTSPLKLFEYMASGVPIVASDLPSIRAILPEGAGFFAEAGNATDFAEAIAEALSPGGDAPVRAALALKESEKYSWPRQAGIIIEFVKNL